MSSVLSPAATVALSPAGRIALTEPSLRALEQIVRDWQLRDATVRDLAAPGWLNAACREDIERIREALEAGPGFSLVAAGEPGQCALHCLRSIYWLMGAMLGQPVEQNVQGTMLYDVHDTGQDVRYGARFSVTNAESTFHTDNSFGDNVVDYVGLLCVNAARSGGASQIVDGRTVFNELLTRRPDVCAVLRRPFHFDRRGGLRPGDEPTIQFPILTGDGPGLVIRYLRYWIEAGHERAAVPMTPEQIDALDVLDRAAGEERWRVEFTLEPGEMLFVNNRWILHNRTAFEDYPEPERQRHYVRLWLRR